MARNEVLLAGTVNGEFVELSPEQYAELRAKYHPGVSDVSLAALDAALGIPPCISCG
jgi:hypothetical protein